MHIPFESNSNTELCSIDFKKSKWGVMNRENLLRDDRATTKRVKRATTGEEAAIGKASILESKICNVIDNKKDGITRPCNTTILTKKEERTSTGDGSNSVKSSGIGSSEFPPSFSVKTKKSGKRMDFTQDGVKRSKGEEEISSNLTVESCASETTATAFKTLDSSNFEENVGGAISTSCAKNPQLSRLDRDVSFTASETTACTDSTAPAYGNEKASHKDKVMAVNTATNGGGESTCATTATLRNEKVGVRRIVRRYLMFDDFAFITNLLCLIINS